MVLDKKRDIISNDKLPCISGLSGDEIISIFLAIMFTADNYEGNHGCQEYGTQNCNCNGHYNFHGGDHGPPIYELFSVRYAALA